MNKLIKYTYLTNCENYHRTTARSSYQKQLQHSDYSILHTGSSLNSIPQLSTSTMQCYIRLFYFLQQLVKKVEAVKGSSKALR